MEKLSISKQQPLFPTAAPLSLIVFATYFCLVSNYHKFNRHNYSVMFAYVFEFSYLSLAAVNGLHFAEQNCTYIRGSVQFNAMSAEPMGRIYFLG